MRETTAAVIGAGISGLAAAIKLKEVGCKVTVFETSPSVGGTWFDNDYPGAEVDTPSVLYSLSFARRPWSRTHGKRDELLEYLQSVATEYGLTRDLRLGTSVTRIEWLEEDQAWRVEADDGSRQVYDVVVSAIGFLNQPKYPDWPGLESFAGPVFHAARWDREVSTDGRRVAVVGSGSTAAQLVPALAKTPTEVVMFQREPGWMLPKGVRDHTDRERWALGSGVAQKIMRYRQLYQREKLQHHARIFRRGRPENEAAEAAARAYIEEVLGERPDLVAAVTPSYPFGGKRPILADDLYRSLLWDNVELVPHAVSRVTPTGVVDATGVEHDIDVLVLATGFHTDFRFTFDIVGRGGISLTEAWKGEPEALIGTMVPGFPNLFIMYGPNTNGGATATHLEAQASYAAAAVRAMRRRRAASVEARPSATRLFNVWIQRRLAGTSFEEANNYYKSASGRNVTQWADGAIGFVALTKLLRHFTWRYEPVRRARRELPDRPLGEPVEGVR